MKNLFKPGHRYYVCTPYTRYPSKECAWRDACRAAAALRRDFPQCTFYSPIAETYGIEMIAGFECSHDEWLAADKAAVEEADGGVVVCLPGWQNSKGIAMEIEWFEEAGKPVHYAIPLGLPLAELDSVDADDIEKIKSIATVLVHDHFLIEQIESDSESAWIGFKEAMVALCKIKFAEAAA